MDLVSHTLFGRALGQTLPRGASRHGITAALVIGSILPDADAALVPRGFDLYLQAHAAGTHSLVGAAAEGLLLAIVLRCVVGQSRFGALLVASWVGLLGHIFWDLADSSTIALFAPLSRVVFGWHLVSMGEPLVLAMLIAAAVVAWRRPARACQGGVVALVLLAALLVTKKATQVWAVERYVEAAISEDRRPVAVTPELGRIFLWTVYDREGDRVRAWRVDSRTGHVTLAFEYVDMAATPAARVSRELPMVQHFLALSILPFAQAQQVGERHLVLWSDLTTCSMRGCDLSFGGAFDAHMTALYQFVQIGGFTQRRPPAAR